MGYISVQDFDYMYIESVIINHVHRMPRVAMSAQTTFLSSVYVWQHSATLSIKYVNINISYFILFVMPIQP